MDPSESAMMRKGLSLADLPADILCLVLEQLPFDDHFAFVSSCKQLYTNAEYILHRHQDAHAKYSVVSDLDPTTVLTLLDKAFGIDPLPAWHIRSLNIWRDRTSWADWMTFDPSTPPDPTSQAGLSDVDILKLQPLLSKVSDYLDWFDERAYEGMYGDWNHKARALRQVESGHDGVLKALLVARCPRLREVRFVPRAADKDTGSSLWWLKTFISISKGIGRKMPSPIMGSGESDTGGECEEEEEEEGEEEEAEEEEEEEEEDEEEEIEIEEHAEEWRREGDRTVAEDGNNLQEGNYALETAELFLEQAQDDRLPRSDSNLEREWEAAFARWQEEQRHTEPWRTDEEENELSYGSGCELGNSGCREKFVSKGKAVALPSCPGFISIRIVAIGSVSNTWMDDDDYPCSLRLFGRLLKLPNLDTLYFNGLRCDGSEHIDENADDSSRQDSMISVLDYDYIEPNSSSVKHLYLEGLDKHLCSDVREMIFSAPRALHTATFRHRGKDEEQVNTAALVRNLTLTQGASLRNLMFHNYRGVTPPYYEECTLFKLEVFHNRFSKLRQLTFNVRDFATPWNQPPPPLAESFPRSLESLVLLDAGLDTFSTADGETLLLGQILIEIIENGRYRNLRQIFVEHFLDDMTKHGLGQTGLEKAIAAGKARDVAIYVGTNWRELTGLAQTSVLMTGARLASP